MKAQLVLKTVLRQHHAEGQNGMGAGIISSAQEHIGVKVCFMAVQCWSQSQHSLNNKNKIL